MYQSTLPIQLVERRPIFHCVACIINTILIQIIIARPVKKIYGLYASCYFVVKDHIFICESKYSLADKGVILLLNDSLIMTN